MIYTIVAISKTPHLMATPIIALKLVNLKSNPGNRVNAVRHWAPLCPPTWDSTYISTSIAEVMGGLTVFVIPNATIDDLQGTSVEFGGSAKAGVGLGVESKIMKSQSGQIFYGVAVSSYGGLGGEIHTTVTYSKMIYHIR